MKRVLKLLLIVVALLAAVYAATPLWLSFILASQLPAGWQFDSMKSAYPGPAGIRLTSIRVSGKSGPAELTLSASDLDFQYRSHKTEIGTLTVDIFMHTGAGLPDEPFSPDDLALPVVNLAADLPPLSIGRVDVALHFSGASQNDTGPVARPLRLDLENLELTPGAKGGFQLQGQLGFEDSLRFTGGLAVTVQPDLIRAGVRFPSAVDMPWLNVQFEQRTQQAMTTTRIEALVDADMANRDWLDSVLARGTRRAVAQVGGKLTLDADFAGQDQQHIERLALRGEKLLLLSDGATLKVDASLSASAAGDTIAVSLASPAVLEYQGDAGWIDELLAAAAPGLQLAHASPATIAATIAPGGSASVSTGSVPFARFDGAVDIQLQSGAEHVALKSSNLQLEWADIRKPESATAEGVASIDWVADAPLAYTADGMHLNAAKLSLNAEVISRHGKLTSSGSGSLIQASSKTPVVAADKLDLTWEALDLETLTGKLNTTTQGFSTRLEDHDWKGFDLDMSLHLLDGDDVSGAGKLVFTSGPVLPLEFTGNTQTMRWDIQLAPASVKLANLRGLLSVAGIKLPAEVKMTDGYLDLQGDLRLGDAITAKMHISGHDLVASMHNSRVLGGGFSLEAGYDGTPWASGPLSVETLELAGGIDLKSIRAELELEDLDRFELKNLRAEAFDGRIELDSLRYWDGDIEDTTVRFSHADLGKLLAYADIDGLQGSGILDITLPVGSDKTGIHVKNGIFTSEGDGRLAYTREGMAGSNIGLKALENFQFKSLSGTLDYQSDGAYLMGVRLEGNNPDLYSGHPVVFNLNINGSLPAVFEAMFMTGSFEEAILKEIKKH